MCCCGKPNVNGTPGYSWDGKTFGVYPVNPPDLAEDRHEVLLCDEPGRCGGFDSHSHHYRLVRSYGSLVLRVRHGGGDAWMRLSIPNVDAIMALDSNARYWTLNALYHAHDDGKRAGAQETASEYRVAFVDGRLRKRKQRGRGAYKVWIEPRAAIARAEGR